MAYTARTSKAVDKRRARRSQQFGQGDDESTRNGALGCTHTVLQFLAWLWKGRWYSQDQISRLAGYPASGANRGLRPTEVQRFCTAAGLPYVVKFGLTTAQLYRLANERGPVGIGHSYSYWPEWYGYRYGGRTADGRPNGYAQPRANAGRTQLAGFVPPNDAHFGLLLGYDPAQRATAARVVAWEPNHGSPGRPEKPAYDRMTTVQFGRVYASYQTVLGRSLYALVPTRSLPL